jgi:hypothetical protein
LSDGSESSNGRDPANEIPAEAQVAAPNVDTQTAGEKKGKTNNGEKPAG